MPQDIGAFEARRAGAPSQAPAPLNIATSDKTPDSTFGPVSQIATPTIVIREAGSKWALRIAPPLIGEDLDGTFDTYNLARGFAGELRTSRGYRIDDSRDDRP